jgi:endonuclease/exonuclease/phosphatase family metal-dependent hydrolase
MSSQNVLKWILIVSNIGACLAMIITLLGGLINPNFILFPAYLSLLFPVTIFINCCFVIIWILSRKWMFLISLSVLLLSATQINNTFTIHFGKSKEVAIIKPIKILTYNTWRCSRISKPTKQSPNEVLKYALEANADIICLQEFTVSENREFLTLKDIDKLFEKYPYKHIVFNESKSSRKEGIATFSKYPIIYKRRIDYPSKNNLSIVSDINFNGSIIRLINNHLESNRLTDNDKSRPLSLKDNFIADSISDITLYFSKKLASAYKIRAVQADSVAQVVKASPYKVLLCGDFNDVPCSYTYTTIKCHLTDAFPESGFGMGWTFNEKYFHFRIDYVMFDASQFELIKYQSDKVKYSDHYPILCTFNIKQKT